MTNGEDLFAQFENLDEYPLIDEQSWELIKETYHKDEVKEKLADIFMKHPIPYADITADDAYKDYMKLKGFRYNEYLKEGEWFPRKAAKSRYPLTYEGKQLYFSRINTGNNASNYFQQKNRWSVDGAVSPGPKRLHLLSTEE